METCADAGFSWEDVGARDRRQFIAGCERDWDALNADLGTRDLQLALEACDTSRDLLATLPCDELVGLYAAP